MLALERQREILMVLSDKGSARVQELARRFAVTEETIRRDLDKLEADGQLVRSHGGAVAPREAESPHWHREFVRQEEKEAIAREAVKRVEERDVILLDASSTCWFLAKRLPDIPLTVVTNSVHIILALGNRQHCKIIGVGGTLSDLSLSFVGSETQQMLRRFHAAKLFLSCRGVDPLRGASDIGEEQAMVRRVMMEVSDRHILLADSSKLSVRSLSIIAPLQEFHELITDEKAGAAICAELEALGMRVTRAAP